MSSEEVLLPVLLPMGAAGWGETQWDDEVNARQRPEEGPAHRDGTQDIDHPSGGVAPLSGRRGELALDSCINLTPT